MAARFNPGANGVGGAGGSLVQGYSDNSGSPGNTTINTPRGRAAIAAAASTCVVTNSSVVATSSVFVTPRTNDSTGIPLLAVAAAGSFTVTAKAAATANLPFDFLVVN